MRLDVCTSGSEIGTNKAIGTEVASRKKIPKGTGIYIELVNESTLSASTWVHGDHRLRMPLFGDVAYLAFTPSSHATSTSSHKRSYLILSLNELPGETAFIRMEWSGGGAGIPALNRFTRTLAAMDRLEYALNNSRSRYVPPLSAWGTV
jgi:hypothetical protein